MDLHEGVDEVEPEGFARLLGLEAGRQLVRDHVPVEEAHHVEGHAEHAFVLADREDVGQPRKARGADRVLQSRFADHVVRRRREGRAWGTTQHEPLVAALDQEAEVRAAAVADPGRDDRPGPETVRVQERLDACLDDQRGLVGHRCDATHRASSALPDAACRGLVRR